MLTSLLGLDKDELRALALSYGEEAYRGNQLAYWIYHRGVKTFEEMTNIPEALRLQMKKEYEVGQPELVTVQHSADGTTKLLLAMRDGAKVETVALPYTNRFS